MAEKDCTHTPSTNHLEIWLEPHCLPHGEQRMWCEDNMWENGCEDCGVPPTKYIRADQHSSLLRCAEALRECRRRFAEYAASHTAKGADLKAQRNQGMVDMIDEALSSLEKSNG